MSITLFLLLLQLYCIDFFPLYIIAIICSMLTVRNDFILNFALVFFNINLLIILFPLGN